MSLPSQSQIQAWWRPRCAGPFVWVSLHGKGRVQVRSSLWEAVAALNAVLVAFNYQTRAADTGAGVCRAKVGGVGWSMHAFWIALDLNWSTNPYGRRLVTDMPADMVRRICAIRTKNGKQVWNWGGFWAGNKDAMHFEVVCSPADLATGIDWSTVWRSSGAPPPPPPPPAATAPVPPVDLPLPPDVTEETPMSIVWHHNGQVWLYYGGTPWRIRIDDRRTQAENEAKLRVLRDDLGIAFDDMHLNPIYSQLRLDITVDVRAAVKTA